MKDEAVQAVDQAVRPMLEWLQTQGLEFSFRLAAALAILVAGAIAIKCFSAFLRKAIEQRVKGENEMLVKFVTSVAVKVCWAFLFVLVLGKLGVEVGPLIAGLGATGLVIGFAFQESLGSLAAGIMIALNKPFKVGDFVNIAGHEGIIRRLDMMAVSLATGDNRRITIPNKQAWGSPIVNYSALELRRADIVVGVAYGTDLAKAKKVALEALASVPGAIADPAPTAAVAELCDSSVSLCLRVWCKNADYWPVRNGAVEAVSVAFGKSGVVIPFPQMDVHVVSKA